MWFPQPFLSFKSFNKNLFLFYVCYFLPWVGVATAKVAMGGASPPWWWCLGENARERPGFMWFQMILLFPCFRLHALKSLKHEFCIFCCLSCKGSKICDRLWLCRGSEALRTRRRCGLEDCPQGLPALRPTRSWRSTWPRQKPVESQPCNNLLSLLVHKVLHVHLSIFRPQQIVNQGDEIFRSYKCSIHALTGSLF